jgi:hypothetical protein
MGGCVRRAADTSAMTGILCRQKVSTELVKFWHAKSMIIYLAMLNQQ